jgi:hypothetical protein
VIVPGLAPRSALVLTYVDDEGLRQSPVWSPQGDLIGFVRKIGVDFEVFTIRPDETIILDAFR